MLSAAPALLLAVPMVQVFINSASERLASMPIVLAEGVSAVTGQAWPLFAPTVGAMGAFVAGSNTISNMMFSLFQFSTAEQIGLGAGGAAIVVAAQAIGGAAGNMICVHNVVAASATVGLVDREGEIIRRTLIPTFYYVVQGGLIASGADRRRPQRLVDRRDRLGGGRAHGHGLQPRPAGQHARDGALTP